MNELVEDQECMPELPLGKFWADSSGTTIYNSCRKLSFTSIHGCDGKINMSDRLATLALTRMR